MPFLSVRELRVLIEPGDGDVHGKVEAARVYLSEYERGHHGGITLYERSKSTSRGATQPCNPPHITALMPSLGILHGLQRR